MQLNLSQKGILSWTIVGKEETCCGDNMGGHI
jgi:hypothetical protein